jgi:hypothetical protein
MFTYQLHPVGPKIVGGVIGWPAAQAAEVLKLYRDITTTAPRELALFLSMRTAPLAPFVPKEWQGKPVVMMIAFHSGTVEQAGKDLARLKHLGSPLFDVISERTYIQHQSLLDSVQPDGRYYYQKSEYIGKLTDEFLSVLREQASLATSPFSGMGLVHVGGAIADREAEDGAVGNRNALYDLEIVGAWNPGDDNGTRHVAWVRSAWEKLRPFSTGGVYINFQSSDEGPERVHASYGKNFGRLADVKARYDPQNLFRVNRNVRPTASDGNAVRHLERSPEPFSTPVS